MANTVRARTWWRKAWPSYTKSGGAPATEHRVVAAGQVIYKGDWVQLNASDQAIYAAAGVGYVYGMALEDGVVGSLLAIAVANEDTVFIMQNKDGVASSACVTGTGADLYVSGVNAARKPQVDAAAPIDNIFLILGQVPEDDNADTTNPGRLFLRVIKSQYAGT